MSAESTVDFSTISPRNAAAISGALFDARERYSAERGEEAPALVAEVDKLLAALDPSRPVGSFNVSWIPVGGYSWNPKSGPNPNRYNGSFFDREEAIAWAEDYFNTHPDVSAIEVTDNPAMVVVAQFMR